MEARFRIRTREGEELRPKTTEIFAEFIRSGVVRPEDLVHDALTGEWIPAALHPMVRLMKDPLANGWEPLEEGAVIPPEPAEPALPTDADAVAATAHDAVPTPDAPTPAEASAEAVAAEPHEAHEAGDDLQDNDLADALRLVEAPTVSPEEEERAFIARMEDERRLDPKEPGMSGEVSLPPLVLAAPEVVDEWRDVTRQTESLEPATVSVTFSEPGQVRHSWVRLGLLGIAVAVSLGSLAIFASVARPSLRVGDRMPELAGAEVEPARPPHRIAATESAVRGEALDAFVGSVDRMRGSLEVGPVPVEWLSGKYLSDPTAYPEVRGYWQRYLGYVEQARADEVNLYRAAYLQALDDAAVMGPVRSLRLATALEDFKAGHDVRAASYDHAWELAAAALALHDTLVELHGRISYEPAVGPRVSADPVIEAAGKDEEAQTRLDGALDRVLRALHADGPLDVASVPGWLARSLRESAGGGVQAR